MTVLLLIAILFPLAMGFLVWLPGRLVLRLASVAALPAVLLAGLGATPFTVEIPWLYLGASWGLDTLGRVFLAFTGILWLACGVFAYAYHAHDAHRRRFFCYFLLAMAGNLGLIVALDVASFLSAFAVMSFASYGLIVHQGRDSDRHAGRVYLALVITGEVMLVTGVAWLVAAGAGTDFASLRQTLAGQAHPLLYLLILFGFGIKLGLLPVHFWLPLAHPAAPTAASAVLSGAMIKAGLLGILRLFPFGDVTLPWLGEGLAIMGLTAALGAAVVGMTHVHPKTVLAYSSISQMGLVTVALGTVLVSPDTAPAIFVAIAILAAHHAFAKAALFLGVGTADCQWQTRRERLIVGCLLAVPALALAGAPLTSGLLAKTALKSAVSLDWAAPYLVATGLTTTLLVARYLVVVWPRADQGHHACRPGLWLPPLVLIVLGVLLPWLAAGAGWVDPYLLTASPLKLLKGSWPILFSAVVAWQFWRRPVWDTPLHLPAGDIGGLVVMAVKAAIRFWQYTVEALAIIIRKRWQALMTRFGADTSGSLAWLVPRVESWPQVGLAIPAMLLILVILLL